MLGGFSGAIWITPPVISLGQAAIPNAAPSRVEVLFAPPGRIPAIVGLEVFLSGVTLSPTLTNPRFTNAQRIRW